MSHEIGLDNISHAEGIIISCRTDISHAHVRKKSVCLYLLPAPQVLKKKILGTVGQTSIEGRKVADMLVGFSMHQVRPAYLRCPLLWYSHASAKCRSRRIGS